MEFVSFVDVLFFFLKKNTYYGEYNFSDSAKNASNKQEYNN